MLSIRSTDGIRSTKTRYAKIGLLEEASISARIFALVLILVGLYLVLFFRWSLTIRCDSESRTQVQCVVSDRGTVSGAQLEVFSPVLLRKVKAEDDTSCHLEYTINKDEPPHVFERKLNCGHSLTRLVRLVNTAIEEEAPVHVAHRDWITEFLVVLIFGSICLGFGWIELRRSTPRYIVFSKVLGRIFEMRISLKGKRKISRYEMLHDIERAEIIKEDNPEKAHDSWLVLTLKDGTRSDVFLEYASWGLFAEDNHDRFAAHVESINEFLRPD